MSIAGKRIIIIAVCVLIILLGILFGILFFLNQFGLKSNAIDNQNPQKQEEMLNTTLEWGRLAPLPNSKSQLKISTDGVSFTRSFRSSFYIAKADLDSWFKASPGLQDADIETINESTKKFVIKPGGGAGYAEAVIDFDKCLVEIYVYWS